MRIKGIAITLAAAAVVFSITALVVTGFMGESETGQNQAAMNSAEVTAPNQIPATTPPEESVNVIGEMLGTSDGKDLSVTLGAGRDTNFAVMNKKQGDILVMNVESDQEYKLEIGIMSVSSDQVYSEVVPGGTGEIKITVPADGDYGMYIKNHAAKEARFRLILDEPLTGPLV